MIQGVAIPRVLIDDGLAVNVCPLRLLEKIGSPELSPSDQIIKGCDNVSRKVLGALIQPVHIGAIEASIEFIVIDIHSSYNLLLGRLFVHAHRAIPSSLLQVMVMDTPKGIVTIIRDYSQSVCAVEAKDTSESVVSGFALEEISAERSAPVTMPSSSPETSTPSPTHKVANVNLNLTPVHTMMKMMGYLPGAGLGRYRAGINEPVGLVTYESPMALGYFLSSEEPKEYKHSKRTSSETEESTQVLAFRAHLMDSL